jgi:hypothetical protein
MIPRILQKMDVSNILVQIRGAVNCKHMALEGERVLNLFVGSGSSAIAAKYLKRKYIDVEISSEGGAKCES